MKQEIKMKTKNEHFENQTETYKTKQNNSQRWKTKYLINRKMKNINETECRFQFRKIILKAASYSTPKSGRIPTPVTLTSK